MTGAQKKALQRYVLLAQAQREVGRELDFEERALPFVSAKLPGLRELAAMLDAQRREALDVVLRRYSAVPLTPEEQAARAVAEAVERDVFTPPPMKGLLAQVQESK